MKHFSKFEEYAFHFPDFEGCIHLECEVCSQLVLSNLLSSVYRERLFGLVFCLLTQFGHKRS